MNDETRLVEWLRGKQNGAASIEEAGKFQAAADALERAETDLGYIKIACDCFEKRAQVAETELAAARAEIERLKSA